jgi:hypothetical protein
MTPQTGRVRWRKSSRSGGTNGNCVELAHTLGAVRDSKNPDGPPLRVELGAMLDAVKADRLTR